MKRVALFEFDNVLCKTLEYVVSQRRKNKMFTFANIDHCHQRHMDFHAYPMVMIKWLRDKNYNIHIYARRKNIDRYGVVVETWLNDKGFDYDRLHIIDRHEPLLRYIDAYTYLVTTDIADAVHLHNMSVLSSATIVNCALNTKHKLPSYCDRLYYEF